MAIRALKKQTGKGEQGRRGVPTRPSTWSTPEIAQAVRRDDFPASVLRASSHTRMGSPLRGVGDLAVPSTRSVAGPTSSANTAPPPRRCTTTSTSPSTGSNPFPQPTRFGGSLRGRAGPLPRWAEGARHVVQPARSTTSAGDSTGPTPEPRDGRHPRSLPTSTSRRGSLARILGRTMEGAPLDAPRGSDLDDVAEEQVPDVTKDNRVLMPNVNAAVVAGQAGLQRQVHDRRAVQGHPRHRPDERDGPRGLRWRRRHPRQRGQGCLRAAPGAPRASISPNGGDLRPSRILRVSCSSAARRRRHRSPPPSSTSLHRSTSPTSTWPRSDSPTCRRVKGRVRTSTRRAPRRATKSERDIAIERIPHAHAVFDHAMRTAMGERGLEKTRFQQGAAWGEEQIHRTIHPDARVDGSHFRPDTVYQWQARDDAAHRSELQERSKAGVGDLYLPD